MTQKEFKKHLSLYGSDLKKWPRDLRLAAEKKLLEDKTYQALLNAEKQFESELKEWAVPAPRSDLEAAILQKAFAKPAFAQKPANLSRPSFFNTAFLNLRVAASIALVVVGLGLGGSYYHSASTTTADDYDVASFFVDFESEGI